MAQGSDHHDPSHAAAATRMRVVDRVWGLIARRAQRAGLLGVAAACEQRLARTWFADAVGVPLAERLTGSATQWLATAASTGNEVLEVPAEGPQAALRLTRAARRTSAAGAFAVIAIAPAREAPAGDVLQLLLDLWETALHAEQEAEQQEGLLQEQRAIVEHITDGLLVVDRQLTVKHMNAAAGRILHLHPATSIGRSFGSLLDFQPIIEPILETGEGYVDRELIITSPQRHLHLIDTAVPIKDKAGRVVSIVNSFREIQRARRIADKLAGNHARYTFEHIVGSSEPMQQAVGAARKAARGFSNVLLLGGSGVGKEVFAQSIHNASSRANGPFIAINCAALPRDLIESELFGYAPGSFTGAHREGRPGKCEAATGGTIFLDEISELPIDVQAKLLRVLQEREVVRVGETKGIPIDVRVVSASNRDLQAMIARREFREDLYYRCHVIAIALPSLAERPEDIPVLANHFLRKYAQLLAKDVFAIEPDALDALVEHPWPGNVRELENLMERLVNMVDGQTITRADLPPQFAQAPPPRAAASLPEEAPADAADAVRSLAEVERDAIAHALRCCGFNVTEAARRLGVAKPTLYTKIRTYGIAMERGGRRQPAR